MRRCDHSEHAVTCGNCERSWCERCDPAPSALCHWCHGRGSSPAELKPRRCDSCELVCISGVVRHEIGCPDAWQDQTYDCWVCGYDFKPQARNDTCCSVECYEIAYNQ